MENELENKNYENDEILDDELEDIKGGNLKIFRENQLKEEINDEISDDELEKIQGGNLKKQREIQQEESERISEIQRAQKSVSRDGWVGRFKNWYGQGKQISNQERHSIMELVMKYVRNAIGKESRERTAQEKSSKDER